MFPSAIGAQARPTVNGRSSSGPAPKSIGGCSTSSPADMPGRWRHGAAGEKGTRPMPLSWTSGSRRLKRPNFGLRKCARRRHQSGWAAPSPRFVEGIDCREWTLCKQCVRRQSWRSLSWPPSQRSRPGSGTSSVWSRGEPTPRRVRSLGSRAASAGSSRAERRPVAATRGCAASCTSASSGSRWRRGSSTPTACSTVSRRRPKALPEASSKGSCSSGPS